MFNANYKTIAGGKEVVVTPRRARKSPDGAPLRRAVSRGRQLGNRFPLKEFPSNTPLNFAKTGSPSAPDPAEEKKYKSNYPTWDPSSWPLDRGRQDWGPSIFCSHFMTNKASRQGIKGDLIPTVGSYLFWGLGKETTSPMPSWSSIFFMEH